MTYPLTTCPTCQGPLHFADAGRFGGWYVHSLTRRLLCSTADIRVCARHAQLNPDYGTCAPIHWPAPPTGRAREARQRHKMLEFGARYGSAITAMAAGDKRSASQFMTEARTLRESL